MAAASEDPELKLASSYCQLYYRLSKKGGKDDNDGEGPRIAAAARSTSDSGENNNKWEEFDWKEEDTTRAEAVLLNGLERCRCVLSSETSQQQQRRLKNAPADDEEAWDRFYSVHQTSFFKDRHYLSKAFPNEFSSDQPVASNKHKCLVEIGCGVGNALLPLLGSDDGVFDDDDDVDTWTVYGLDLSGTAIDLLKENNRFRRASNEGRAYAFCSDIIQTLPKECTGVADITTLLFCLSAIDPEYHVAAACNAAQSLSDGGVIVFRDYGLYDEAQLKLASQRNKLLKDNFYRKHDGTKCYYFTTEDLERLFCKHAGLGVLELRYLRRVYKNRSTATTRRRVWVQARFRKPLSE